VDIVTAIFFLFCLEWLIKSIRRIIIEIKDKNIELYKIKRDIEQLKIKLIDTQQIYLSNPIHSEITNQTNHP
jgi:hypothetical protein